MKILPFRVHPGYEKPAADWMFMVNRADCALHSSVIMACNLFHPFDRNNQRSGFFQ